MIDILCMFFLQPRLSAVPFYFDLCLVFFVEGVSMSDICELKPCG